MAIRIQKIFSKNKMTQVSLIIILTICLGLAGCGKKGEAQIMESGTSLTDEGAISLTAAEEEYLTLASDVDALIQKKSMLFTLSANAGILMPSVEEEAKPLSAEECMGRTLKEESSDENAAYVIENMHTFWSVYDNLKGNADIASIPKDNLDSKIQELKNRKIALENEVSELEKEFRVPVQYGFSTSWDEADSDELDSEDVEAGDDQKADGGNSKLAEKRSSSGWSKLKVNSLDAAEGYTALCLEVIDSNYPGLSAGDIIYVGGDEFDPCVDNFAPLLFGSYVDQGTPFEAILDQHTCGSGNYRIKEFLQ